MSDRVPPRPPPVSPNVPTRIEQACKRFEAAWRSGRRAAIEAYLQQQPEQDRASLLVELLRREVEHRAGAGETPSVEEYRRRFPQHADAVAQAFESARPVAPSASLASAEIFAAPRPGTAAAIPLQEFLENLARSGLFAPADIAALQGQRAAKGDAQTLAQELVRAGRLTQFQAQRVLEGTVKGLVLGEYVVLDKIGHGGMGDVYKARHRTMDRIVALKVLRPERMQSPQAVERFRREVATAAKLEHPNIVTAYDAGEADGTHFLVMQYVEGTDLARLVGQRGPLPVAWAVEYVLQAARGLEYAHRQGVVHRDIKPGNCWSISSTLSRSSTWAWLASTS